VNVEPLVVERDRPDASINNCTSIEQDLGGPAAAEKLAIVVGSLPQHTGHNQGFAAFASVSRGALVHRPAGTAPSATTTGG
jgi:hypothetical protein